ncbi:CDP-glycerol glycerophosphotransferase family protein [Arthrobacter zhaoxinii]|uniref:CDP-glycerol glycerophosphotransferase family protein n=1 Tax=Arthrobacter zhaoxinii TaxID=2964616 RepID=A0ABY5YMU5_9MICC|nr:CDP-glycerol glycerophosphotransferase family protein [Arthrobacter zhaoxinii]UWX96110.1 CDP-glycerol glycerophosphotransferase family protein [Arthrobacter zhaoxinii]
MSSLVHKDVPEASAPQWYAQRLTDLMPHMDYIQHSGHEYFEVIQRCIAGMLDGPMGQGILQFVGVHERVLLSLTAAQRRGDVLLVLADLQDNGRSYLTAPTSDSSAAGQRLAVPAYLPLLSSAVEPWLLNLAAVDLRVMARLTRFEWVGDGSLHIGAWAYLAGIDPADSILEVGLRQQGSCAVSALAVHRYQDPRIDVAAADRWRSYAGAAFAVSVDTRTLMGLHQPGGVREWTLQVTLRVGGFSATDLIRVRDVDLVPRRFPVGATVDARSRVIGLMDAAQGLRLKAVRYTCVASTVEIDGNAVRVGFGQSEDVVPVRLYLDAPGQLPIEFGQETNGTGFIVDAASVAGAFHSGERENRWALRALLPNGKTELVAWGNSGTDLTSVSEATAALRAECTGYGYLQLSWRPERLTLTNAQMLENAATIILEGRVGACSGPPGPDLPDLVLRTARDDLRPSSTRWLDEDGSFQANFSLLQDKWGHGESAWEQGHYRVLHVLAAAKAGGVPTARVPALGQLLAELPLQFEHELLSLELVGEGNEQDLVLRVSAPRTAVEWTALHRNLAITAYAQTEAPVDPGIVLFETFDGKFCSDSGRAISDLLGGRTTGLQRYWSVADFSVPVPRGCTPVLRESMLWFRLLATAGYLVNNNNFPHYFRKRTGQVYLQTWHGTPLKSIGADTPVAGTTASYRALITREAAAWDMLLAQNKFAADTLSAAFGYRTEPAIFGYPRNDALTAYTAPVRRAETRRRLGIEDGQKMLLYAPTWRNSRAAASPYLDFEAAAAGLGQDYVLHYRGHHKIAGQRKTTGQDCYVDVTSHPDINDLYLAADLLVTDYSSAMFDFCVTGKPIYFLTPDLAQYRDSERGFYFDFEEQSPGPLVRTTDELVTTILNSETTGKLYRGHYRDFVRRYAPQDDGGAAARVIEAVWARQEGHREPAEA